MTARHRLALGISLAVAAAVAAGACATTASRCRKSRSSTARPSRRPSASRSPSRRSNTSRCRKPLAAARPAQALREAGKERKDDRRTPKERIAAANAAARIEPAKDGYINAIQVYPYTKGALYQLYAAVNQVTDIALGAGREAGLRLRRRYRALGRRRHHQRRGQGRAVHILVKPIAADLETNLVITTDRRTYHLEMHASAATYMASVSWTYPAVRAGRARSSNAPRPSAAAARCRRRRQSSSSCASAIASRATRPGSRGRCSTTAPRSTSSFPSGLAQSEAPPLFVIGPDGKPALVNYRVRGTTYIVDRLFAAAELRLGTAPQRVVRIVRTDAVWRETQP